MKGEALYMAPVSATEHGIGTEVAKYPEASKA